MTEFNETISSDCGLFIDDTLKKHTLIIRESIKEKVQSLFSTAKTKKRTTNEEMHLK